MPEEAPAYDLPGARPLTPAEEAFRKWVIAEGAELAVRVYDPADLEESIFSLMEAAFGAGWVARGAAEQEG